MTAGSPGPFSAYPTSQLEDMLRRREAPAEQLDGIRDELSRRYDAELTGTGGFVPPATAGPPGPAPPSPGRAPTASYDPSGWGGAPGPGGMWPVAQHPPPPLPMTGKPGGGIGRAMVRLVVAVVVALVALGAYAAYEAIQEPSAPSTGSVCVTFRGSCPLSQALPLGSSCFCTDGVTQDPGTVQ